MIQKYLCWRKRESKMFYHSYNMKCRQCGHIFEIVASFETINTVKTSCPICYSEDIGRKFAVPSVHFQGRGFYSTDNKKENKSDQ